MSSSPIQPIAATPAVDGPSAVAVQTPVAAHAPQATTSFAQMLLHGIDHVSEQASSADALVRSFVLDDNVPPHRVLYALEQSRLSMQMMLQVRNRLIEGYQEIMRMQL